MPIPEYRAPGVSEADSEGLFISREPNGLYVNPVLLKGRVTADQVVGLTRTSFSRTDEKVARRSVWSNRFKNRITSEK